MTQRRRMSPVYTAKTFAARFPSLALPIARARKHGVVVDGDTDVVIEGYPRSANSFSVVAFEVAQGRRMRIAHHTHAPAHVLAAIRLGKPVIVLARDPADAVLEFLIVRQTLAPQQAIRGYLRFYESLLARDGYVVGAFPEVTTDFGAVMRRLNERFGSSFVPFEHTPENVERCFSAMDEYWRGRTGGGVVLERRVGRPSEARERMKDELRPVLDTARTRALLAEARGLYEEFTGGAEGSAREVRHGHA